ncbi:MAG: class I SAM-dependent methyltransferase [Syntrophales bacterium]|nr:class I SAM-dependent methyltransferase [Syntrophales bacterium]
MEDGYYHLALKNNPIQRFWHSKKFELVSTKINRAPAVDVGSGPGAFFNIHGDFEGLKINLDYSFGQLSYSRKINPGVFHINASATDLPFPSESLFTVLLIETIEHFDEEGFNKILKEILRVLKKGGKAVISTPNYKSIWPFLELIVSAVGPVNYMKQHITHFDIRKLGKTLEERGFRITDKKTILIISPFLAVFSRQFAEFVFKIEQRLFSKCGSVIIMEVVKE